MATIPQKVLDRQRLLEGLKLLHRGKVRDTYELDAGNQLVVASDRISIFDFVLNAQVQGKGEILTAMNHFWTKQILQGICETDFIAVGSGIDAYLPAHLCNDLWLQRRATVVRRLPPPDVEDIVRIHLTGSGLQSYLATGKVCGHELPPGLKDGSVLPEPIYTPTTKALVGHDEHVTAQSVRERYGPKREQLALQCAAAMAEHADRRGIILADTKFEFTVDAKGNLVLIDEKGTPDSSRFWLKDDWQHSMRVGKMPAPFDKQRVRNWGIGLGINTRDPENPEDVSFVHGLEVPEYVLADTTELYRKIFRLLIGCDIGDYQRDILRC